MSPYPPINIHHNIPWNPHDLLILYVENRCHLTGHSTIFGQGLKKRWSSWRCWCSQFQLFFNSSIFSSWWFGTWLLFFHILGIIIPIDELIFFRGVGIPPTSSIYPILLEEWQLEFSTRYSVRLWRSCTEIGYPFTFRGSFSMILHVSIAIIWGRLTPQTSSTGITGW